MLRTDDGATPTPFDVVAAPTPPSPKLQNAQPFVVFSMEIVVFAISPPLPPGNAVAALDDDALADTTTGADCSIAPSPRLLKSGAKGVGHMIQIPPRKNPAEAGLLFDYQSI